MNKLLLSIIMVLCTCAVTGCWDRKEVKDLALVMATGVDKGAGESVRVTLQVAIPSGVGGGTQLSSESGPGKSFTLAMETGENMKDADLRLQEQLPRKLYTAHRRVILIGEDEAKSGIQHILDQFGRDPTNRMRDLIIIAKGGTAEDFLHMRTVTEKVPGDELKTIEEEEAGRVMTLLDFLKTASSDGISAVTVAVEKKGDAKLGEQPFDLHSTAVFKNLKLVGYLDDKETQGMLWMQGRIPKGYITARIAKHGTVTAMITSTKRKIHPSLAHGKFRFDVAIEGKGELVENNTNLDMNKEENFKIVKKAFAQEVTTYIEDAYHRAQQYDTDVFGLGQELYRTKPRQWNSVRDQWKTLFQQAQLNLDVDIEPLRTGMTGPPLHLKQNKVET